MPPLIDLPEYLLRDAKLFAPGRDAQAAAAHVLEDYSRLVGEVRQLRRRVAQLDEEGADFDARLQALQNACRAILDL
jgi:hypothetical protein